MIDHRFKAVFVALVVVQAVHSIEEYVFKFYEVFPPARQLDQMIPGIARPGFVVFNLALVGFGLLCAGVWVLPARPGTRVVVRIWVVIELYNGVAHLVWAVLIRGYNPGLVTAPLFLPLAAYLAHRLNNAETG